MEAIFDLGKAIGTQAVSNEETLALTAYQAIGFMFVYLLATINYQTVLNEDQEDFFIDSMQSAVGGDTSTGASIAASADYEQYQVDESKMNSDTGKLNSMVQNQESMAFTLGDTMQQVYSLAKSPEDFLKLVTSQIVSFFY